MLKKPSSRPRAAPFGLLSRTVFREIFVSAILGVALFSSIVFLQLASPLFKFLVTSSGPPRTVALLFALLLPQRLGYKLLHRSCVVS